MPGLLTVATPACIVCGGASLVTVDRAAHAAWKAGQLVQLAFPDWTNDQRELLVSGTHPHCWDVLNPDDDYDDDEDDWDSDIYDDWDPSDDEEEF